MSKLKLILATAVLLLCGSGAAFAASGHVPEAVNNIIGSSTSSSVTGNHNTGTTTQTGRETDAAEDQYSEGGVSTIAKDKSDTGTMTLPNGKEIENHGLAVSQAAKAQHDDEENEDQLENEDQPQAQSHQSEDNNDNQNQMHDNAENGTSSSQPVVSTPRGGQHTRH